MRYDNKRSEHNEQFIQLIYCRLWLTEARFVRLLNRWTWRGPSGSEPGKMPTVSSECFIAGQIPRLLTAACLMFNFDDITYNFTSGLLQLDLHAFIMWKRFFIWILEAEEWGVERANPFVTNWPEIEQYFYLSWSREMIKPFFSRENPLTLQTRSCYLMFLKTAESWCLAKYIVLL